MDTTNTKHLDETSTRAGMSASGKSDNLMTSDSDAPDSGDAVMAGLSDDNVIGAADDIT